PKATQTMEAALISLIQNTVRPDSWKDVGGQGTIQYFPLGMALVVNQSPEVQEEVFALLDTLRKMLDQQVAIELKLVSVSEASVGGWGPDFVLICWSNPNAGYPPQLSAGQFLPFQMPNSFQPGKFVSGLAPAGTFTPDLNVPIRNSSFDFSLP